MTLVRGILSVLLLGAVLGAASASSADAKPLLDLVRAHDKAAEQAQIVCDAHEYSAFELLLLECRWARADSCERRSLYWQDRGTCELHFKMRDRELGRDLRCDKVQGYRQTRSGRIKTIRRGTSPWWCYWKDLGG